MTKRTYRPRNRQKKTTGILVVNENRADRVIEPLTRYLSLPTNTFEKVYGSRWLKDILKRLYQEAEGLPLCGQILTRPINTIGFNTFHSLAPGAYQYTAFTYDFIRRTRIGRRMSDHDLHSCMLVAWIEAALGKDFISHLDILAYEKCPPATWEVECPVSFPVQKGFIEPDALFGHEHSTQGYKFYAMELDRHTESLTVIDRKIANYDYVLDHKTYESFLGIPNIRVLWFTYSEVRATNIRSRIKKHPDAHIFKVVTPYKLSQNAPEPDLSLFAGELKTARGATRLL